MCRTWRSSPAPRPPLCGGLDTPDAIFIGGGATAPGLFETAWTALARGGRLVVNGVTLETQALLFDRYRSLGGTLKTIQIAHAGAVGGFHGMRPGMAVTQWAVRKPW